MMKDAMTNEMLMSGLAFASAPEGASPVATSLRTVPAVLDLHGFTKEQEIPWPPPYKWTVPISRRLWGSGIALDDALEGNEELLAFLSVTFVHQSVDAAGVPRYTCHGCSLCRLDLLDSLVNKLATQTAKAVLDQQAARHREDRAERAAERDARRLARETAKKRPARRRRTR